MDITDQGAQMEPLLPTVNRHAFVFMLNFIAPFVASDKAEWTPVYVSTLYSSLE